MKQYKVGQTIQYRGSFGVGDLETVTIECIEICEDGGKYGASVESITEKELSKAVMSLDNGHWCYGSQVCA